MGDEALSRADRLTAGIAATTAAGHSVLRAGLWMLLAGQLLAFWGTQWDILWHLRIGRDSFWIPPHVMTYGGVTAIVLVSFGVLAWTTGRRAGGRGGEPSTIRMLGLAGTRGYHLAAWSIALTVLAAPIDDLWHRMFGLDVTLWSPPHLLGLLGGILNAAACWLIARETYPPASRARLVAIVLAGALVYAGVSFGLQPGVRIAYVHGGVRFFTYPILGALLLPPILVLTARLSALRMAPILAVLVTLLIGMAGAGIARAGFAWIRPPSFIAEEIAKDPTSPIALIHEIARRNGTTPGAHNPRVMALALLASFAMCAVDARRRPVRASLAFAVTLVVAFGAMLARMPAFAESLPSLPEAIAGLVATALAGLAGGVLARLTTPR